MSKPSINPINVEPCCIQRMGLWGSKMINYAKVVRDVTTSQYRPWQFIQVGIISLHPDDFTALTTDLVAENSIYTIANNFIKEHMKLFPSRADRFVLITDGTRSFIVNPEGYSYARYAGLALL